MYGTKSLPPDHRKFVLSRPHCLVDQHVANELKYEMEPGEQPPATVIHEAVPVAVVGASSFMGGRLER